MPHYENGNHNCCLPMSYLYYNLTCNFVLSLGEGLVATINKEVRGQKRKLDHFVKTLMQLKGLPKVTEELKNRLKALENMS